MDIRQPFSYKIGNSTFHVQTKFVSAVALLGLMCLIILFLALPPYHIGRSNLTSNYLSHGEDDHKHKSNKYWFSHYNSTYPLTPPVFHSRGFVKFRIAIVSDLDTESKHPTEKGTWFSYLKKGYLTLNLERGEVTDLEWDSETVTLTSQFSYGGRGMELSELITFNGRLYALDDRTGIIYEVDLKQNLAIPWVILTDGNGRRNKGFKSEWATVKDETLIVGSLGKEWTTPEGAVVNHDPQFVKTINTRGEIGHHDWRGNYAKMLNAEQIKYPGYMIHEACGWSEVMQRWIFLPRRSSHDAYSEAEDEHKGTNLMIQVTEGFEKIKINRVGDLAETHGFSSFKFIPHTNDKLIVALKSEEVHGKASTFIMVFTTEGKVVYPERKIADYKFEGIEFI